MRDEEIKEVEVTVEKTSKTVAKKKAKVGRPKKEKGEKKKQISGGFTKEEEERIRAVLPKHNLTSTSHFMRTAGLKLLEELEK